MKILSIILVVFIPAAAGAFNVQEMNKEDIQKMMNRMQEANTCMQKVDQGKLKLIEQRSREMESEVKSLCDRGERDKAQKKVMEYGKEMEKDPTMKKMKKCSDMMGEMPEMPFMGGEKDEDRSSGHICD